MKSFLVLLFLFLVSSFGSAQITKFNSISVTTYGAVCDGSHDDGAAINSAIATVAASGGGRVILPAGTCLSSVPITFSVSSSSFVNLAGLGENATTIKFTGTGSAVLFTSAGSTPTFAYSTLSNMTISGTAAGAAANGIRVSNTANIDIDHVIVNGFPNDCLQLDSAQYMHISNSNFSACANWGIDIWPARANPGVLNNTILFTNDYFLSNGTAGSKGGGSRTVGAEEITFDNCTFQGNQNYGAVDTGDVGDAVGGLPPGSSSYPGKVSTNIRYLRPHFEWNTGYHHYVQYAQMLEESGSVYASTYATSGSFFVENHPLNEYIRLSTPYFVSVAPYITVMNGSFDSIDTGNLSPSQVNINANVTFSRVFQGNVQTSGTVIQPNSGVQFFGYADADSATIGDIAVLQGAGARIRALNPSYGVELYTQGNTYPFDIVGAPTTQRFITFPDANITVAGKAVGASNSIGGSFLSAGACTTGTASVAGAINGQAVAISQNPPPGFIVTAEVSSANTVTVQECAIIAGTPPAQSFLVTVIQ